MKRFKNLVDNELGNIRIWLLIDNKYNDLGKIFWYGNRKGCVKCSGYIAKTKINTSIVVRVYGGGYDMQSASLSLFLKSFDYLNAMEFYAHGDTAAIDYLTNKFNCKVLKIL